MIRLLGITATLACALIAGGSMPAQAIPSCSATVSGVSGQSPLYQPWGDVPPGPQSIDTCGSLTLTGNLGRAYASVQTNGIHVSATAQTMPWFPSGGESRSTASANFYGEDLLITDNSGSGAQFVRATMNIKLDGTFASSHEFSSGTLTLHFFVNNGPFGSWNGGSIEYSQSNLPVVLPLNFDLSPGRPYSVRIGATATARAFGPGENYTAVDFGNTISFQPDEVATLPAGYTLDSVDLGVVNNQFVGFAVPEPNTALLVGLGLLVLGVRTRRHA